MKARTLGQLALITLICFITFSFLGAMAYTGSFVPRGEPGYEAWVMAARIHSLILALLMALFVAFLITGAVTYILELRARVRRLPA